MTNTLLEPLGTNLVVGKRDQAKFYVDDERRTRLDAVFDRQGLKFTEGMERLVDLLLTVPESMQPVLLRQAHGEAAIALAEYTLKRARRVGGPMAKRKSEPTLKGE